VRDEEIPFLFQDKKPPPHLSKTNKKKTANGRIPALVDKTSGTPTRVFEGGSMMLYLCAKYDASQQRVSFAYDTPEYWETVQWITWMQSGIGPMQGQANHFYRYVLLQVQ